MDVDNCVITMTITNTMTMMRSELIGPHDEARAVPTSAMNRREPRMLARATEGDDDDDDYD